MNIWDDDVKFGEKGESILKQKIDRLFPIILLPYIKRHFFKESPKEQLSGKDITIPKIDLEVKTRRYRYRHYNDILLEIESGNKQGWFFTTTSKFVSYGFLNEKELDYLKGKAWILNIEKCRECFTDEVLKEYPMPPPAITKMGEIYYKTYNRAIPIESFPNDCLIPFPEGFWNSGGLTQWLR